MRLLKLGFEQPNLVKKFQSFLKIWIKCRPNFYDVNAQGGYSNILSTWFVTLCVSVCKRVCTHRLKLQFRTIFATFDNAICSSMHMHKMSLSMS